jgi:DHA2 family methylenomycin A resistance protein-like MFS transporter
VFAATSVTLALPAIQREFDASGSQLQWIVNLFVLVHASLIVAGGGIADARGRKGIFLLGVACFGLGSMLCAVAPSLTLLMAARVIQGLGPSMMLPSGLAILTATYTDRQQRAAAVGAWSAVAGLATTLGPPAGGLLVDAFGWRSVFLVNVPFACVVLVVGALSIARLPRKHPADRFDGVGVVLAVVALSAVCTALIEGRILGWGSPAIVSLLVTSVICTLAFVRWERRHPHPLIEIDLFRDRWFVVPTVAALAGFFGFMVMPIYLSLYFPLVGDLSPLATGVRLLPVGVASALAAPVAGYLTGRFGPRWPLAAGMAIAAAGLLCSLRLGTEPPTSILIWQFVLIGIGGGLALPPMTSAAVNAVAPARVGTAAAIHNSARQVGFVLGVAVLGSILYATMDSSLEQSLAERSVPEATRSDVVAAAEAGLKHDVAGVSPAALTAATRAAFVAGMHSALVASAIPVLVLAVGTFVLMRGPPAGGARPDLEEAKLLADRV